MIRSVQRRHIVRWLSAILVAIAWAAPAHAQYCSYIPAHDTAHRFGFPQWIGVPAGAPDGTVLASTIMSIGYSCPPTTSPSGWSFVYSTVFKSSASVPGDLYRFADYGLAVRVTNLNTGQRMKNDSSHGFVQWIPPRTGTAPISGTLDFKIELVKLNDVIYNPSPYLAQRGINDPFGIVRIINNATLATHGRSIFWHNGPITLTSLPQSCRATLPDTSVQLDRIYTSRLPTPGSTAGDKPFNVGLSCSPGTNVYVTLTDLTQPGNTTDRLTLAPGSTASGVQLRLLRPGGVPVSFGPDSSSAGNLNQWHLGASGSTTGIPLTAQYIATGAVTAGSVRGVASFTLSYQ